MKIGEKIKEVFESRDIKLTDFADQIGTVRQNLYRIFERESIDTDLLLKISNALNYDFFQFYKVDGQSKSDLSDNTSTTANEISALKEELSAAEKEIEYLKKIVALREEEKNLIESKFKTQQDLAEAIINNLKEKETKYLLKIKLLEERNN